MTQHRDQLPIPEDGLTIEELITKISIETGRNLLFLYPFIRPTQILSSDWTFTAAWNAFIQAKEVSKIHKNLQKFIKKLIEAKQEYTLNKSLSFMTSAICKGPHMDMTDYYDARYFCVLDGIAHCVSQYIARCAASVIEEQCRIDLFRSDLWRNTIRSHRNNPSVLGFMVEKAVIGYLSNIEVIVRLLKRHDLHQQRVEVRTFKRGTETATLSSSPITLYIPEEFNYKAVDCVLRIIDRKFEKPISQPKRRSKRGIQGEVHSERSSKKNKKQKISPVITSSSSSSTTATTPTPRVSSSTASSTNLSSASPDFNNSDDDDENDQQQPHQQQQPQSKEEEKEEKEEHDDDIDMEPLPSPVITTVITLLPLQITITSSISPSKRERSFRFFDYRNAWCADFEGDPRVQFCFRFGFIGRRCAMEEDEPAIIMNPHNSKETFQLSFFSLANIDEQLDRAVDSPSINASNHNSPPRFQLAVANASAGTSI